LNAYCRYRFFIPDPVVRFTGSVNPNASLPAVSTRELCPICYEPMIEPEGLLCGHSFCLLCVHEWAQAKISAHQRPVCPVCRAVFRLADLRPREAALEDGELRVWTVEPLLRRLGILNCKTIKAVSIFKAWSEKHTKWFWKALDRLSDNLCERRVFLSLARATLVHVLGASDSELVQALGNFEIDNVSEDRGENGRKLLLFLFERKVIAQPPCPGWLLSD
jgi:transposase-like protein